MIEGQRELGQVPGDHLAVHDPGPFDDPADAQDRHLGRIDDGGRAVHAEHAVIVDGEGPAGEFGGPQRALPGPQRGVGQRGGKLLQGAGLGIGNDRHQETAIGLRGEAQVHGRTHHDRVVFDLPVQLGITAQPQDREPGQQRQQADLGLGVPGVQRRAQAEEFGGIRVDPDRRLGDLPPRAGELVGGDLADALERYPDDLLGFGRPGRDGPFDVLPGDQAVVA